MLKNPRALLRLCFRTSFKETTGGIHLRLQLRLILTSWGLGGSQEVVKSIGTVYLPYTQVIGVMFTNLADEPGHHLAGRGEKVVNKKKLVIASPPFPAVAKNLFFSVN
jgi:hypothetical protein